MLLETSNQIQISCVPVLPLYQKVCVCIIRQNVSSVSERSRHTENEQIFSRGKP